MRTRLTYIYTLLIALLTYGCQQMPEDARPQGKGGIILSISTGEATRALTPGDGNIYEGGGMEDLTVVLVNPMGTVSDIQHFSNLTDQEQQTKVVTFTGLDIGNYTLYAYANTERALLSEVAQQLASLSVGSTFDLHDSLFTQMSDRDTPEINATNPLLLTAYQSISIGADITTELVVLTRPVVWFEVLFINNSVKQITITDVSFSDFNPSTSYVLPHDGVIPSSVTYRALPSYDTFTGGADITIEGQSQTTIYRTSLFENRAPSYTLSLDADIKGAATIENAASITTSIQYLLKNSTTGNYLADNGSGGLTAVSSLEAALSQEHAMWRFSGTRSGYLTNVATGNRYYRSTSAANSGSNLTIQNNSGVLSLYYSSGWRSYYLRDNNGSISYSTSTSGRGWQLQVISGGTISKSVTDKQIYVIDSTSGTAAAMSEQLRNQHITVTVNAYYNDISGIFDFAVVPWIEKDEEVNFN